MAAELAPSSLDARLRCAEALLRCGRASEAREAFASARLLVLDEQSAADDGLLEAICGQARALDALGRGDEATAMWTRGLAAPVHAAPPQPEERARWFVAAARCRVAFGELAAAEELLMSLLASSDALDAQVELATVFEAQYAAETVTARSTLAAAPRPPPTTDGRDKLGLSLIHI